MRVIGVQNPEDSSGWIDKQAEWGRLVQCYTNTLALSYLPLLCSSSSSWAPKTNFLSASHGLLLPCCFLQQSHQPSARSRCCQGRVTSSFAVTVDLCLNVPLRPLLLCGAQKHHGALEGVGVLAGIVCLGLYLEVLCTLTTPPRLKCLFTEVTWGMNQRCN